MKRASLIIALLVGGVLPAYVRVEAAIEDGKWGRYESTNFEIYSRLPEWVVSRQIRDLKAFRAVIGLVTGRDLSAASDRLATVSFLPSQRHLTRLFQLPASHAGFMRPNLRENLIVIARRNSRDLTTTNEVAYHEYVHHVMQSVSGVPALPDMVPRRLCYSIERGGWTRTCSNHE